MSGRQLLTRRRVLQTTGAAAGIGLAGTGGASLSQANPSSGTTDSALDGTTNWPQFQGNAAKTGVAGGGPTSRFIRWEFGDERGSWYSQPAVNDGTLYVPYFDEAGDESEADDEGLLALTTDGDERWRYRADADISIGDTPAVGDGLVFVTGQTHRTNDCGETHVDEALLLAIDAATGEEVYRRTAAGLEAKSPTVAAGAVYVVYPASSMVTEGTLVAYETTTGNEQWRVSTGPQGASGYTTPPVSVAEGRVYLPDGGLQALDTATGEELWSSRASNTKGQYNRNAPAIVDGTVYVGTGGVGSRVYAISADDGSIEWEYEAASDAFSSAAVTAETVYVSMESIDDPPEGVHALSTDDGSKQWLAEDVSVPEAPIRSEEYLYVGRKALSPEDGSVAWSLDNENVGKAVAGETLYLGGPSILAVGGG